MFECSGNERLLRAGLERCARAASRCNWVWEATSASHKPGGRQGTAVASAFTPSSQLAVRLNDEDRFDMRPINTAFPESRTREAFELVSDRKRAMEVLLDFAAETA
jgi:L-idonate 5-dehydrogenase